MSMYEGELGQRDPPGPGHLQAGARPGGGAPGHQQRPLLRIHAQGKQLYQCQKNTAEVYSALQKPNPAPFPRACVSIGGCQL
jgi:hypothetical protein